VQYEVCGIPIAAEDQAGAAKLIAEAAEAGRRMEVHLCNAYTLSLVDSDPQLRAALSSSDLNLADGTPVAAMGRRCGMRLPVRGPTLVGDVAREGVERGLSHYFFGGKEGVGEQMVDRLRRHAGGLQVAGVESPPFRPLTDEDLDAAAERIKHSGADLVWVGVGTPVQDYLVPRLAARLSIPVIPVGAAFDFWAGTVKEAPAWLHGSGLEWAHRLKSEPRRLWRRYLLGNPRFVWLAIKYQFLH
jgi:N-acetylglucosaminyldiphosphoundecaprenol N-acetyl-beta-D-mannosaminyltransferase